MNNRLYKWRNPLFCLLSFCIITWAIAAAPVSPETLVTPELMIKIEKEHGEMAKRRLLAWKNLMDTEKNSDEKTKLVKVNEFFNLFEYKSDIPNVGVADYWMTPVEFIIHGAGDCKDFAIAKYFTLQAMGIPIDRLRMTYVKAIKLNQAHMVLTYFATPDADPLVLDNLIPEIKLSSERTDLSPVYSLNTDGVWLAKQRGLGARVGGAEHVSKWQGVLERMQSS